MGRIQGATGSLDYGLFGDFRTKGTRYTGGVDLGYDFGTRSHLDFGENGKLKSVYLTSS